MPIDRAVGLGDATQAGAGAPAPACMGQPLAAQQQRLQDFSRCLEQTNAASGS